jgi:putative lipoic acid-binding regulatory protein
MGELLVFPCEFSIKIFGLASKEFQPLVLALIRKHLPDLPESALQSRASADGKYIAFTATLHVNSREQLDNIYRELTSNARILMVL